MPSEYFFQKIQTVYHCRQSKVYALFENRGPDSTSYAYTEVVLLIPFRVEEKGSSRGLNTLPRDTQLGNIHSDIAETRDQSLLCSDRLPRSGNISESSSPTTCQLIFWLTFSPSTLVLHCGFITVQRGVTMS